jgi:hypothetical protein
VPDHDAPTRARLLWDEGDRAEALALLKGHLRQEPHDIGARLALAELYRELIAPDQAGRWGIAVPGWTTEVERDRLARMIAHSGIADHEIPDFLALPEDAIEDAERGEVAALLPDVERYRVHFADPGRTTRWERKAARQAAERAEWGATRSTVLDVVGAATDYMWWIIGFVFALGAVLVWGAALFDQPVTALARWSATATLGTAAVVCAAHAYVLRVDERIRRKREPDGDPVDVDVVPWISGAILLGLVVAALVTEGLRGGGPLPF